MDETATKSIQTLLWEFWSYSKGTEMAELTERSILHKLSRMRKDGKLTRFTAY